MFIRREGVGRGRLSEEMEDVVFGPQGTYVLDYL